jgi:hypothetical protein
MIEESSKLEEMLVSVIDELASLEADSLIGLEERGVS